MRVNITNKELEVLKYIAEGFSSEEIAKLLENSKKTIDAIRSNMMVKFGVRNAAHLVTYGFREGWLK